MAILQFLTQIGWLDVSIPSFAFGLLSLILAFFVVRTVYNVTFHPLAKFPGPKARAISQLPTAFASWQGSEPKEILQLHEEYGTVVRVSPDTLSFTSASAWQDIYGHHGRDIHGHQIPNPFERKDGFELRPGVTDILLAKGHEHTRQRSAFNRAFSMKALSNQEPILKHYTNTLMKRLEQRADTGEETDMVRWFEFTAFDIVGSLGLSTDFGCLEGEAHHPWVLMLMNFFKAASYMVSAELFGPVLFPLFMPFAPLRDLKKVKMHAEMSAEKVQQRLARIDEIDANAADIWSYILKSGEKKSAATMSASEMEANAAVLLIAGTEPVATALSGAVWYLSKFRTKLKKLHDEIDAAFERQEDIGIANSARLPYLTAVVTESLRIYPPFAGMSRRQAPAEGAQVDGIMIPGNAAVGIAQLASFRSPTNFSDPNSFIPERWLNGELGNSSKTGDNLEACQPFSIGPKNCVGKALAFAEMRLVLASLVWYFDWELCDDDFDPESERILIMHDKRPLRLRLKKRIHGENKGDNVSPITG